MPGRKRFISRDDSSTGGGASSISRDQHGSTGVATNKSATLPASASPGLLTGISEHGASHHRTSHHRTSPDTRGSRSRSQYSSSRSQLPPGSSSGSRMARSYTVESPSGSAVQSSPRSSDTRSSLRTMRHDSASSSTSDVPLIKGNLASLRASRPFSSDSKRSESNTKSESQPASKFPPSWTSGHMTYPGRRSASNESDRISDVSQQATSVKGTSNLSTPRSRFLATNGSPVIAHHIASPPESRRPIPGAIGSPGAVSPAKARTLSAESSGFGSIARQKLFQRNTSKDRSSFDSTTSEPATPKQIIREQEALGPAVEHGPARAKPFLGRSSTIQLPLAEQDSKSKRTGKRAVIPQDSPITEEKLHGQQVLKDIDNTIKDMTKALHRDIRGFVDKQSSSFDSPVSPVTSHATNKQKLTTAGSTREERISKYKQARRKELAKIGQGKSKSLELPETEREKYLSEMEAHTPKFSRKYGSRESLGSKESLDDKTPATFTSIAVPTQQIVMPSPVLPKSVTSPPIATVSPIMVNSSSLLSSLTPGSTEAPTTLVTSHPETRMSTNADRTMATIKPPSQGPEMTLSAFKPVKASSPTKIIPTSAPLDQLTSQSRKNPLKATSPTSPIRTISHSLSPAYSVPTLSGSIPTSDLFSSIRDMSSSVSMPTSTTMTTVAITTASSLVSLRSPKSSHRGVSSSSSAMSILPKSTSTSSSTSLLFSSPVAMVTSTLTTSTATSVTTTTASLTSPLTSVRSASSSDVSSFVPKRHVLKKQSNVEESESTLKQFVMTPAAIARAEKKLGKSKSETSVAFGDHDPKQSANAYAEKTFLEKSRRTSKDIEKWEDLIMNVADMQHELENIEFEIKQANNNGPSEKPGDKYYKQKESHKGKTERHKGPVSKPTEHKTIREEIITEEIKIRPRTSPEKRREKYSPEKMKENSTKKPSDIFNIEQLIKQEAGEILQSRKKLLQREDSFNRPDSPLREPMALPKDSVIKRNRLRKCGSSSSSDGGLSPQRSPRVSPRVHRRKKQHHPGASMHTAAPSNTLTVEHAHKQAYNKDVGGRRDPNRTCRWRNVQCLLRRGGILPDSAKIVLLQGRHYMQQNNRAHRLQQQEAPSTAVQPNEVTRGQAMVKVLVNGEGHNETNHKMEPLQKRQENQIHSLGCNDVNRSFSVDDRSSLI